VTKPRGTAAAFAAAVLALGWSRRSLGRAFGVDERQIRRWESGADIPDPVLDWMTAATGWLAANPPPRRPFDGGPPMPGPPPHRMRRQASGAGGRRP